MYWCWYECEVYFWQEFKKRIEIKLKQSCWNQQSWWIWIKFVSSIFHVMSMACFRWKSSNHYMKRKKGKKYIERSCGIWSAHMLKLDPYRRHYLFIIDIQYLLARTLTSKLMLFIIITSYHLFFTLAITHFANTQLIVWSSNLSMGPSIHCKTSSFIFLLFSFFLSTLKHVIYS